MPFALKPTLVVLWPTSAPISPARSPLLSLKSYHSSSIKPAVCPRSHAELSVHSHVSQRVLLLGIMSSTEKVPNGDGISLGGGSAVRYGGVTPSSAIRSPALVFRQVTQPLSVSCLIWKIQIIITLPRKVRVLLMWYMWSAWHSAGLSWIWWLLKRTLENEISDFTKLTALWSEWRMQTIKLDCLGFSVSVNPNCCHKKGQDPLHPSTWKRESPVATHWDWTQTDWNGMILSKFDRIEICVAWQRFYFSKR